MSDTAPIEGVGLDEYIRARARLEHASDDLGAVVASLSLPDADVWRRVDRAWRERMEGNFRLARVVEEYLVDYVKELRGEVPDAEPDEENDGTAEAPQPVRQEVPSYLQAQAQVATSSAAPVSPAPVFAARPALAISAPAPVPVAPAPVGPAVVPASMPAPETAPLDLERLRGILLANPTPFMGKTSPERLQKLRAESVEEEETQFQKSAASRDEGDETAMFVPTAAFRAELNTLPFATSTDKVACPELSVDQYAALAAEMQAKGPSAEILARYRVTSPKELLALHAEQERRFTADPALRARFEERKAHFIGFMKPAR